MEDTSARAGCLHAGRLHDESVSVHGAILVVWKKGEKKKEKEKRKREKNLHPVARTPFSRRGVEPPNPGIFYLYCSLHVPCQRRQKGKEKKRKRKKEKGGRYSESGKQIQEFRMIT